MKSFHLLLFLSLFCVVNLLFGGTTGKITGIVTDTKTGEPLPAVNITVVGTRLGAATDMNGYYVIQNLQPGDYDLKTIMMGYNSQFVQNVHVRIDLTTTVNISLSETILKGEEVVVVAERPVVQVDISSSQANLSANDIEALPIVNVASVVGLEAGIQGLSIRGGGADQTAFMMDGFTMRDERNNSPYTAISYTSIDEIQIQTGGFNAEFGNIRSGLINVVTKSGKTDRYSFGLISRYRPSAPKHFGQSPNSPDSYWIKPYVDDAVCWTGTTNGVWNSFTQKQYIEFEGWNAVAAKTLADDDPDNDLTPAAAQKLFLWEHRRQLDIKKPDYDIDASFGGPVPFINKFRFFASYRNSQNMYLVPLSQDAYRDYNAHLKLTYDINTSQKIVFEGLVGEETGTNDNNSGDPGIFTSSSGIAYELSNGPKYIDGRMYGTDYWCPTTVKRNSIGLRYTNVVSERTFYEFQLQRFASNYDTNPGTFRDTSKVYLFGDNYYVDEAPFGYQPAPSTGIVGLRMGVGMSNSRDSSIVIVYTSRFDITSQINQYHNIKSGFEFNYTDNNVNYASVDQFLQSGRSQSKWHTYPTRGALYVQDKLEFKGMIANIGLRLDYSHAGGDWYEYDKYDNALSAKYSLGIDTLLTKSPTKHIFNLSPRIGISFPITDRSKLYFNYGHFRQLPTPENLYLLRRFTFTNAVTRIASPNNPLPKTVAYELGYEQSLIDQFLIRGAGYYKDTSNQPRLVNYESIDYSVDYSVSEPRSYQDTRGFEVTLRKNRGAWIQGFINYTYEVTTAGSFGVRYYSQNPVVQRDYERENKHAIIAQSKPVPRPFVRANIDLFLPEVFGPKFISNFPFGGWRLNILVNWREGSYITWTGGGSIPGIRNNVQWKDYYNIDLRFSKAFMLAGAEIEFFMDVSNATNFKYMSSYGFVDSKDYDAYMKSLHLPAKIGNELKYGNIPGEDQPGDYRTVPYEPYDPNDPDDARKKRILETKAYIDMPNLDYFTFLNPRNIFWGLKISFDINTR